MATFVGSITDPFCNINVATIENYIELKASVVKKHIYKKKSLSDMRTT